MSLGEAPFAVTGVLTAKILTGRRVIPAGCPVTHQTQLLCCEHLQLPHSIIISTYAAAEPLEKPIDHANPNSRCEEKYDEYLYLPAAPNGWMVTAQPR